VAHKNKNKRPVEFLGFRPTVTACKGCGQSTDRPNFCVGCVRKGRHAQASAPIAVVEPELQLAGPGGEDAEFSELLGDLLDHVANAEPAPCPDMSSSEAAKVAMLMGLAGGAVCPVR
jgi:hypothetical protein